MNKVSIYMRAVPGTRRAPTPATKGFVLEVVPGVWYQHGTVYMAEPEQPEGAALWGFQNTRWSMVLAAHQDDSPQAHEALSRLCEAYWYPIYAFIRRRGSEAELAKDLTQEFFARLLAKQYLRGAQRERGRFRTFLLSCVEHFLSNERKKDQTLKRGGQYTFVPLETGSPETRYHAEPAEEMSPDRLMDRRWGLTMLELTFQELRAEYAKAGKLEHFEALQTCLSGAKEAPYSFAELATALGMSEAAARQAAVRMRGRFGELLRKTVAQTVTCPQDLEAELGHLRSVLSGHAGS